MRRAVLILVALCLVCVAGSATATPVVVKNIATGIDDITGQKLAYGTLDTDYVIGAGSTEGVGLVPHSFQNGGWLADGASSASRFIAIDLPHPESQYNGEGDLVLPGIYFYETSVNLAGYDASTAQISGFRFSADNELSSITINGISVFSDPTTIGPDSNNNHHEFHDLGDLGLGSFQSGLNTIRLELWNSPYSSGGNFHNSANGAGLRVEGLVTAAVPEPNTALLLGIGLAGLGMRRSRTRRGC